MKRQTWNSLPIYKKIKKYGAHLGYEYSVYADKIRVKQIVKGAVNTAKLVRILSSPDDITEDDIHPNHIIKARHASGYIIDLAKITSVSDIKRTLQKWNHPYQEMSFFQSHYSYIPVGFYIEEKIDDLYHGVSSHAATFMFRCFHGEPKCVGVIVNKEDRSPNYLYTIDWNQITHYKPELDPPRDYTKMIEIARQLSKPFPFVRLDLYQGKDGVYLSEFTFTPSAGKQTFSDEIELWMGKFWQ